MNRKLLHISAALLVVSCASSRPGKMVRFDEAEISRLYPVMPDDGLLVLTGKVRLELPRYRVRGTCRILRYPDGRLQIDFIHSSLFGSYREDATIYVGPDRMIIEDHERGEFWDSDSTLALLRRHFGFEIYPDDISYNLLFARPESSGVTGYAEQGDDGDWVLEGVWRERDIEIRGIEGEGPLSFSECAGEERVCYITRYKYPGGASGGAYPEKIVIERVRGVERLSLTVTGIAAGETAGEAAEE